MHIALPSGYHMERENNNTNAEHRVLFLAITCSMSAEKREQFTREGLFLDFIHYFEIRRQTNVTVPLSGSNFDVHFQGGIGGDFHSQRNNRAWILKVDEGQQVLAEDDP